MEKEYQHTKGLGSRLKKLDPTARATYFPMEGKFLVFLHHKEKAPTELTGNMHEDKQVALIEAIQNLESRAE
jgi:hypothetical protein